MLRLDADTIVAHREDPFAGAPLGRDVHARRLHAVELDGVADQVLEHLHQLRGVGRYAGQRVLRHLRPRFLDRGPQIAQGLVDDGRAVGRLE